VGRGPGRVRTYFVKVTMAEKIANLSHPPLRIAVIGIKGIPARYGGFETCADETCRRLITRGHHVTVYCRKGMGEAEPPEYAGITLRYVPFVKTKNLANITSSFLACLQAVRSDAEVIHLYTVGTALFIPWLKLAGKRTVISVDALDWKRAWSALAGQYLRLAAHIAVRCANELIIDSRVIQQYYKEHFRRAGAYVPFGANVEPPRGVDLLPAFNLHPRRYILFVGILRPEKQVDHLIRAFNSIRQDEFELAIVGDDPMGQKYVAWLKSLAGPRVRFLGRAYGEAYMQLCQNAYLYVCPSNMEGTSPALLGAMGAGCAVLVNGIPENLETIGEAGFSYRMDDIDDLRAQLAMLMHQPDLVAERSHMARERVLREYNWDAVTDAFEAIYYQVQNRRR